MIDATNRSLDWHYDRSCINVKSERNGIKEKASGGKKKDAQRVADGGGKY